jgi:hypothetical protein
MVYDTLKDHAPPHLACAVHCEGSRQQCRVIPDGLRISVLGQVEDEPDSHSDLLRLHGAYDVDGGVVTPIANGLAQLDEAENDSDHDSDCCRDLYRRRKINLAKQAALHRK